MQRNPKIDGNPPAVGEFGDWLMKVAAHLTNLFGITGEEYIADTGHKCWHVMFCDGLSPYEAAHEEYIAACEGA
jgi:hypothetical protein